MKKTEAKNLAQSITRQIKNGSTIDVRKLRRRKWRQLNLPYLSVNLNDLAVLAVFEVHKNENDYWIALTNWRTNHLKNYYLVTFGRDRDGSIKDLCELHECDGLELRWQYNPTRTDGKNVTRKKRFSEMYGSTEVSISIPTASVSVDEFLTDVLRVAEIRKTAQDLQTTARYDDDGTFPEGRRIERLHRSRERSPQAVSQAKENHASANDGRLPCEICGFEFQEVYGERGKNFIEAHHKIPLGELKDGQITDTTFDDLALVCANCHRMLHRNPYFTVEELKRCYESS